MRNNNIEFWRFIFTTLICLFHFSGSYFNGKSYFSGGYIAVEFFFILSGFLLMSSYFRNASNLNNNKSALKYTFRRISILYPHYIFSFMIIFIYKMLSNKESLIFILKKLVQSIWEITMLQMSGIQCSIYNQPTWYISALIIVGYLIYYLLNNHMKIYIELIAPFSIIFIYAFLSIQVGHVNVWINYVLFIRLALFRAFAGMSLGCICYMAYKKLREYSLSEKLYNTLDLLGIVSFCIVAYGTTIKSNTSYNFIFILLLAIGVTISFLDEGFIKNILNNKLSAILGKLSYPMFLNHIFVMGIFCSVLPNRGVKIIPIYILAVMVYSFITYKFVSYSESRLKHLCKV